MFLGKCTGGRRRIGLGVVGLLWAATSWAAVRSDPPAKPSLRIPLNELGFPGYAVSLLHAGQSMATVHALDSSHVLFTYSLRSLVPRLPGDDANDSDREVAAVLVEVPSGKVLARTKWRLHDHGRYLWSVGPGVFAVRMGSDLSVLAPLQGLAAGAEPFTRYALPHRAGQPVLVAGSPDGKLVTVELESERKAEPGEGTGKKHKHYTLEFFRLMPGPELKDPIAISGAGAVASPVLLRLAMDGDGYLWAEDEERGRWTVSFNEYGGKQEKLAPVMSSCNPRLSLLSRSQFLVETCRGSEQALMLAAFGFDGHENWQEQFGETLQPPTLALAPAAGRFAMSRLVASSGGAPVSGLGGDNDPLSQEIRVYQTESGDVLLHVFCAPTVRSAENFDLSPDGSTLVVLAPQTVDVYKLPELSAKDRKDLAEVQTMMPPTGAGPVALARLTRPIEAPESVGGGESVRARDEEKAAIAGTPAAGASGTPPRASAASTAAASAAARPTAAPASPAPETGEKARAGVPSRAAEPQAGVEGEAAGPRRPPTLLAPGERPEFKGQSTTPR